MRSAETKEIVHKVNEAVDLITTHLSNALNLKFTCYLSGSFLENTKCFAADEFDFTLNCLSNVENTECLPLAVYA